MDIPSDARDCGSNFVCPHADCGKGFSSRQYLKRHLDTHQPSGQYPCDACGKAYKAKEYLRKHMKACHPEPIIEAIGPISLDFKCFYCVLSFSDRNSLVLHLNSTHELRIE